MNKYDVIVVGGGYPGCSTAYHLTKAGKKTILIEKKEISSGASGGNFGCIQIQDANLGLSLDLTLRSFKRVMKFEEELCSDLELTNKGSLIVAANDPEMEELEELYKGKKDAGLDIYMLDRKKLKEFEPNINEREFLGATYFLQGRLNPFKLMYSFIRRAKENGLDIREYAKVERLHLESGIVKGVELDTGEVIYAENVVVCAGAWTKELCKSAGIYVPIDYVRAEGFVTEKIKPFINNYFSSAAFFTDAHDSENIGMSLCMGQTASGNLLIGETSRPGITEPDSASNLTSLHHFVKVKEYIEKYFPSLRDINLLRAWTTVSPYTESMEPVLGKVGPDGLIVAAGFKSCVIMTAVVGEIVTDLIIKGKAFCDLSLYTNQVTNC